MTEIGNKNLLSVRLDPARLAIVKRLRKRGEGNTIFLRRAIDALAEKEGVA